MVTYVTLPKLTWTMEEGLMGEWYKKEGDYVEKGEPICEIETEKTVDDIEAPESGVLRKVIVPSGSFISVNQLIAVIADPEEFLPNLDQLIENAKHTLAVDKPEAPAVPKIEQPKEKVMDVERIRISPVARKLAVEHGVDLTQIKGTGPNDRIVKEDVLKTIEKNKAPTTLPLAVARAKVIPLTGMRKVIMDRLSYSARTALQVPLTIEVDMSEAVRLLTELRPEVENINDIHISYTDILVKAVAKALEEHPIINSIIEDQQIIILDDINIGVAVALENGIIVPVIHNANGRSVTEIAKILKELIDKARKGELSTREASGGTFTISNLGMFGIDLFAPIINPPESAILGVGKIARKPVVLKNEITVRSMVTLCLVFDHRVMDGAEAASFLQTIKQILENLGKLTI